MHKHVGFRLPLGDPVQYLGWGELQRFQLGSGNAPWGVTLSTGGDPL